jgi:hypothetical protein
MPKNHQRLPPSGPERESLRQKGQFWTPPWVADAMVGYVLAGGSDQLFDPAVGAGAFFHAAARLQARLGRQISCSGTELDPGALEEARESGLSAADLGQVEVRDFIRNPPADPVKAIVANPPYIRHHRLDATLKAFLRSLSLHLIGKPLDGRAGLHVYFLLRALELLDTNGRLAFIVPADIGEGVFAQDLWGWIASNYRLDAAVTFAPEASPFPGVDTNPLIVMIRNVPPAPEFVWARCVESGSAALSEWTLSGFRHGSAPALVAVRRKLSEGIATGLTRPPSSIDTDGAVLGDFARVMRGIATGANTFFHLTRQQALDLRIPDDFLTAAIGRTRDVPEDEVTGTLLDALDEAGRPTLLFCPDGRPAEDFPKPVRDYLAHGERLGLPSKSLISTRRPWYKMEHRPVPPFLFAYLGRRNTRFVRNSAGVVPLTAFLCVYPRRDAPDFVGSLGKLLRDPETLANLPAVGKSYGGGAIKVEPRALERLPLPQSLLDTLGLTAPKPALQSALDFGVPPGGDAR